jgi:hypothetical protein
MPPTIIETLGRLAFELEPLPPLAAPAPVLDEPPLDELPLDEQAATPTAATHATAASPSRGFLRDMDVLL